MTTLQHQIVIQAPAEHVWQVLADLEAVQHYNPLVASARYETEVRYGIGAARICEFRSGGSVRERVTEWEPETGVTMEALDHSWPMRTVRWRIDLSPENGATRLSQALRYEFTGEAAHAEAIASQWDQGIRAVFDGLKAYAEATAS